MPVILKETENSYKILDPFYAGEWEADREFVELYLEQLRDAYGGIETILVSKSELNAESTRLLETAASMKLPMWALFDTEKVRQNLHHFQFGIITPPVPIFEVSSHCNYGCPWCYLPPRSAKSFLSLDILRKQLIQPLLEMGTRLFVLTGGEPALAIDRVEHVCGLINEESQKMNIKPKIALLTNGFRLSQYVDRYKKAGIASIQVSLVSLVPEMDSKLRRAPRHVDSIMEVKEGTIKAIEKGISVSYNFVLLPSIDEIPSNVAEIPSVTSFAKDLGVYMVRIVPVVGSGQAQSNRIALSLPQLQEARKEIEKARELASPSFIVYSPIGYEVPAGKPVFCRAGTDILYIDAEGWTYPCNNLILPEFRCWDTTLLTTKADVIWRESNILRKFRKIESLCHQCSGCRFRTECGGQCRALIVSKYGQIDLAERPKECYVSRQLCTL